MWNRNCVLLIVWISLSSFALVLLVVSCGERNSAGSDVSLDYPESKRVAVVDTLHGVPVADPYRWLEDTDDPEVQAWTDEQNALTREVLDALPVRQQLMDNLKELWNYERMTVPKRRGELYFYEHNDGLQNQDILYMQEGLDGERVALIDPNELSEEGIVAMDWWYPSHDGSMIAYGLSEKGSENSAIHIYDVEKRESLPYSIDRCRHSSIAWLPTNDGFFYSRTPAPGTVPEGEESYHRKIYLHHLNSDPEADTMIFEYAKEPTWIPAISIAEDLRTLLIFVYKGSSTGHQLYYSRLESPSDVSLLADGDGNDFIPYTTDEKLFIHTNDGAPFYKVMAADLANPERENWREVVPEREYLLENLTIAGNRLVLNYLENATSRLEIMDLEGEKVQDVELPAMGSVSSLRGKWDKPEFMFKYTSFVTPSQVKRFSFETMQTTIFHEPEIDVDPDRYEVKQEWFKSKDGTDVPMFIVHEKGIELNGSNPTLMYGYGGFQNNQTPYFSTSRLLLLRRGGVYALPNIRGGNEFGEEWHRGGMLEQKQNTFDDFIAAGEHLIERGYTSKDKLAIWGGSNGGLLVGAVLTQRPDLFEVVICTVPLLDMIRFHRFLIAKYWTPEYGSAENPDQFEFIYEYSPYHNVTPETDYPATFIKAGEADGRVHPLHARKFAAMLQYHNTSDEPILLWIDRKGGHGQGKPISLQMEGVADTYAFLLWQLGLE